MLGPPKPRHLDEPIAVSLEQLVPANHYYRHLEAKLDLSFVREWVIERYAERGGPSMDPVVFFKLQLIVFFERIRSERRPPGRRPCRRCRSGGCRCASGCGSAAAAGRRGAW